MDPIFTVIVIVLLALAVSDLVVGVSNDAANFLNSAIGSKAAPRWVIMLLASVGIIIGAVFSSGMMEIARNGVFHPGMFSFQDIMMLFLAVMITDIILLDLFNTLGLPTSTTVSLIFELLGAAVIVALFIISRGDGSTEMGDYLNSGKALAIISGILLSVVVAFVFGSTIMYITRLIFSFRYKETFKLFGPLWCGFAFTAITYFALFKGLKGSSIVTPEMTYFLDNTNTTVLLGGMFLGWTVLSAILQHLLKVNVLKLTVLAGTFSLALAFAGNDLVNFIGVSVAGLDSYMLARESGDVTMMMGDLAKPVVANTWILLAAGGIMAITLWTSKKARTVSATELNLARQDEGVERFGSTLMSRGIVRFALNVNKSINRWLPEPLQRFIKKRFYPLNPKERSDASFDLIRATVNLTVASLLIALGTSLKLPLSTTYVTFMVGMGSSLADRAWGRESAVYRITGVLTVISGWFLTAFIAFGVAALVATVLMWLKAPGVYIMLGVTVLILIQSTRTYRKRSKREKNQEVERSVKTTGNIMDTLLDEIRVTVKKIVFIYNQTLVGVFNEDRKLLKKMVDEADVLHQEAHRRKHEVFSALLLLKNNDIHTGHYYVQVVDYLNEVSKALYHICKPCYKHIDNNHEGFTKEQVEDLMRINKEVSEIYDRIIHMLETSCFDDLDNVMSMRDDLFDLISEGMLEQIRRTKKGRTSSKAGTLFFEITSETKTMVLQSRNLLKSQKLFVSNIEE